MEMGRCDATESITLVTSSNASMLERTSGATFFVIFIKSPNLPLIKLHKFLLSAGSN